VSFSLVDKQLGHYELLGGLGSGAMSEVYLARDTRLDRLVAVKVLSAQILRKADGVQRFEREAQAAARLEHPNVATVFTSGSHEGKPYYAMELIRGWSFRELVESRVSFRLDQILPLFAQACVGLEAAFLSGVTHRDVKPGNLMVAESGELKVVDFGLARLSEETARRKRRGIMGTPFYLAPEVIAGAEGDHLSDLYSLGVTFWEVLIGSPPFDADTPRGVLQQHVSEEAPLLIERNPALPTGLSDLVAQMMAKEPSHRPASFEDVHQHLRDLTGTGELLSTLLRWCGSQHLNSFADGTKCGLCGRPYDQRKRPETFHVDLVSWNGPEARRRAAEYIGEALGYAPETIDTLLDPLPFRAAFRARREAARRMYRDFHEQGVEVELVPADDAEGRGQLPIQRLPISPTWPQTSSGSSGEDWAPPGSRAEPEGATQRQLLLTVALLLVASTALGVTLINSRAELAELRTALAESEAGPEQGQPPARGPGLTSEAHPHLSPGADPRWVRLDTEAQLGTDTKRLVGEQLTRSVRELTERLPTLTRLMPMEINLVYRPLRHPSTERVWTASTWAPRLDFPVAGITQVSPAELAAASDNLTARALIRRAAGPSVPGWLIIGVARLREQGPQGPDPAVQGAPTQDSVRTVPSAPREASPAQELLSARFVDFLVARAGWPSLDALIAHLASGRSPEDAVLRSFGVSLEDLEVEWSESTGRSP
jgi:hypothetical protein